MLVVLPAIVAFLGLNVWILVTSLRTGEYHIRSGGQSGSTAPSVSFAVSRDNHPVGFWLLAALNVCVIIIVAYVVYAAAIETYKSWLAGQWN